MNVLDEIPGGGEAKRWFGGTPRFHDAEILELCLRRHGTSQIRIHAWNTAIDADGYFERRNHVVVTFLLDGVYDLELSEFNHQNVIYGLSVERAQQGYRLRLEPCFGLFGHIDAQEISVELEPGAPDGP